MKVILSDYVPQLGEPGDAVEVAAGYARNYLVPRKLAFPATAENIKTYENNLKQRARKIAKMMESAQASKATLEAVGELEFIRKAGEEGKLFGSVTNADIEEALKEKGFEVEKKKIALSQPVKKVGQFEAQVKIHPQVTAVLNLVVKPEAAPEIEEGTTEEVATEEVSAAVTEDSADNPEEVKPDPE